MLIALEVDGKCCIHGGGHEHIDIAVSLYQEDGKKISNEGQQSVFMMNKEGAMRDEFYSVRWHNSYRFHVTDAQSREQGGVQSPMGSKRQLHPTSRVGTENVANRKRRDLLTRCSGGAGEQTGR